ncbi:hypothetical protein EMCRGX_G007739 [Ephydatia muelleri]
MSKVPKLKITYAKQSTTHKPAYRATMADGSNRYSPGKLDPHWDGRRSVRSVKTPLTVEITDGVKTKVVHVNRLRQRIVPDSTNMEEPSGQVLQESQSHPLSPLSIRNWLKMLQLTSSIQQRKEDILNGSDILQKDTRLARVELLYKRDECMMLKENNTLKKLDLDGCGLQPEGLEEVIKGVQVNTKLGTLNLSFNTIDNKRASCLGMMLKDNNTLKKLNIKVCELQPEGLEEVIKGVQVNTMLKTLDLSGCTIDNKRASCLAHALKHNTTLSELELRGCGLRDEAICELCGGLKWCKLKKLDLFNNTFGDQGAKGLADVLKDHPTLEELDVRGCVERSVDGVQYLVDAMMSNTRVKMLTLDKKYKHLIVPQELLASWKLLPSAGAHQAPPTKHRLYSCGSSWAQAMFLEMATCCLNGTLYPCHVGSSHSWWAQRMGRMYASISGIISGCFFPTTAMHMVKHMVQVHTSSTALRLALATSRPGRITWCWGCGSGSSTPCMPMACSTHSSTWICSTSLFASGGNPLPTDTYVRLEQGQTRGWIGGESGKSLPCPIPYTVYGLQLFTAYKLVQACTSGGCGQSNSSRLKTLQAMPTSQAALNVTALNAETALSNPNGLLIHTIGGSKPSASGTLLFFCQCDVVEPLSSQWDHHSLQCVSCFRTGERPSHYLSVPWYITCSRQRSTALWKQHAPQLDVRLVVLPMSQHSIVATVQFHTYNPSGILFHQINSVVTDFLGVKLHGGLPWLIFDVGSGPAVVHRYGFDAVSVQNVGSTYIIVSWDLPTHSNGILINFSLYCNGALAGVLPLTVISYNTTGLLPFTLYMYMPSSHARRHCTPVGMGVNSAAGSLPRTSSLLEKGQLFCNTLPDQKSILKGQTALDRASDKGVIVIAQELLKFTPNVNTTDKV